MLAAVARPERSEEGLSEEELIVARGIVYSRFRGHFKDVTKELSQHGQAELVAWGTRDRGPLFRIGKFDGRFVAFDKSADMIDAADRLETLLDALRVRYPPMSVL